VVLDQWSFQQIAFLLTLRWDLLEGNSSGSMEHGTIPWKWMDGWMDQGWIGDGSGMDEK